MVHASEDNKFDIAIRSSVLMASTSVDFDTHAPRFNQSKYQ